MNTNLFPTKFVTATLLTAGIFSCMSPTDNATPTPGSTASQLRVSAPFAAQTTDFAFDLLKRVNEQDKTVNTFVSPLSLHIALGMLLNGANGQTAQEIQKTLKLDAQTLAEANQTYENLIANLPGVDPKVQVKLANSVWYRNTFAVETSFQDVLRKSFKAEVTSLDFAKTTESRNRINQWASDQTNGKIKDVIKEVKPEHVMFLLNALYFKGDWKKQFKPENTTDKPFKLLSGTTKNVKMMQMNTDLRRAFRPTYTAFELPYANGNYVMTVLLPSPNSSADALINNLSATEWNTLQKDMTEGGIDIGLPKFTMEYEITLNSILAKMGMPTVFTNSADLTKINPKGGLAVDMVKQNTFVAVDEVGTEAAAVTSIGVVVTSLPVPYVCDRPFVFLIHEKTSNTVLFMGKIVDPQVN